MAGFHSFDSQDFFEDFWVRVLFSLRSGFGIRDFQKETLATFGAVEWDRAGCVAVRGIVANVDAGHASPRSCAIRRIASRSIVAVECVKLP